MAVIWAEAVSFIVPTTNLRTVSGVSIPSCYVDERLQLGLARYLPCIASHHITSYILQRIGSNRHLSRQVPLHAYQPATTRYYLQYLLTYLTTIHTCTVQLSRHDATLSCQAAEDLTGGGAPVTKIHRIWHLPLEFSETRGSTYEKIPHPEHMVAFDCLPARSCICMRLFADRTGIIQ